MAPSQPPTCHARPRNRPPRGARAIFRGRLRERSWSLGMVLLAALGLALAILPGGCGRAPQPPRVLIIGIDGADWRMMGPLLEAGELPHLQSLIDRGVSGPLSSLYPIISPVIWTTIATGKGPDKHGVLDFTMPDPQTGRPIVAASTQRRSKAFWNILSDRGLRTCVIGWWASWPAEPIDGVIVSDRASYHAFLEVPEAEEGLVSPEEKQAAVLNLREEAEAVPYETASRFMDITAEEYDAAPPLEFTNPISHFRHIYRTMDSYAAIAKHLMRTERPDVMAVYFEGVDTAGHMYMRYAPPPYPYSSAEDRRKFGHTVEAFYRYQDELIGELLALTDENTSVLVVSDHGFLIGRERPIEPGAAVNFAAASRWHRYQGVFVLAGPDVRAERETPGEPRRIRDATVFDVTPTLLALLDLPGGEDMDGRVLTDALRADFTIPARIPSHEDEAWREDRAAARRELVSGVDDEMQERLRSLGYIGASEYEETLSMRAQLGLAEYYMFRREFAQAADVLEEVRRSSPGIPETYYLLGVVRNQLQEFEQAGAMFTQALELAPEKIEARMELATLHRRAGDRQAAIAALEPALATHPLDTRLRVNLGMLYKEVGELNSAEEQFSEALRLDPDCHPAHAQLALIDEARGRLPDAATRWQTALRLRPGDEIARQHLEALQQQGFGTEEQP